MSTLGLSLGSHYRHIRSCRDVEKILSFFVEKLKVSFLEVGFYDVKSYEFYLNSYLDSKVLREFSERIHLHLPRKDWKKIGVKKILADAKNISKLMGVDAFIIHEKEYQLYNKQIDSEGKKVFVENRELGKEIKENGQIIDDWVCDIGHFYREGIFQKEVFRNFLNTHEKGIREVHFAYKNHELFDDLSIRWWGEVMKIISEYEKLQSVLFLFEGTSKKATSLEMLCRDLEFNYTLLKKINKYE